MAEKQPTRSRFFSGKNKKAYEVQKSQNRKVVLVHGIAVPRISLGLIQLRLEKQYARRTYNHGYNSWTGDIPDQAKLLSQRLKDQKLKEFDAVTHSMGAIVLRWAMNHFPMPALRRAVLIAPPNNGSALAEKLHQNFGILFRGFWGPCALQMRPGDLGIAANAGPLKGAEVGIIAGGSGTPKGVRNLFGLEGDNDRIVTVEETILPGMKDFVLLRQDHTSILISPQTAHMVHLFLEHGVFRPPVANTAQEV